MEVFSLTIIFVFVLWLSYYSTKLIARAKIKTLSKNNMKVIETISIGFNHIHIIKVNNQYFLISSSKDGIRFLSEIDGKDLIIDENNTLAFEKHLKNYFNKTKAQKDKGGNYEK